MKHLKPTLHFIIFFLGILNQINAQANFIIKGRITDDAHIAIPDASILILNANDSSIDQTTLSDNNGNYTCIVSSLKNKLIKATAIGYADATEAISDTVLMDQNIDFILQKKAHQLNEITIASNKKTLERKPDRIIFNVGSDITTNGSNALDVVKKSPGVIVKQQDNTINLIGKSNVGIMINDRLLQLSGDDLMAYLQAIPAENIDRVEVITAPPAKYDASGNSGLINIVLKKNTKTGIQGNARMGYEQASYGKGMMGGDMNYRTEQLNVFGNINYTNGSNQINERLSTPYPEQIFKVHDDYKRILKPLQYTVGADYNITKNSILGVQWTNTVTHRKDISNSSIHVLHLPTFSLDSTMLTKGGNTTANSNNLLNINYTIHLDTTGKKISFDANGLWFNGKRSNDFNTTNYYDDLITPTGISSKNRTNGKQDIQIKTFQTDVELPYKWAVLSLGGKLSFIKNVSNNTFGSIDSTGYHEDASISNSFDYDEKVQALYASAQRTIHKWSFQLGLRTEFTETKGYSKNLNQTNTNQYFNLFPTAYIQYQLNDNHVFNINYSKRIERPSYRSLDPYRSYATPYHYSEGNPFLSPSINHNIELDYTLKSKYTFGIFYQYEQNHFAPVWLVNDATNVTSSITLNFANFISYGVNSMATLNPFHWLEMQAQLSFQQQDLQPKDNSFTQQSYKLLSYYAGLNNAIQLNKTKTLLAEINVYYISKNREDFLEINPVGSVDMGLKALLFKKKLSVSLNANDIFATQQYKGIHVVTGQTIDNYFDTRNVRLTLQYKFGNSKMKEKRERNLGIEDEKGRMQ